MVSSATLSENSLRHRHALADSARDGDWNTHFKLLGRDPRHVNAVRPDGNSLYAPIHQAAWHGAPVEVVQRLIEMGAWRMLPNSHGERALDIAILRQHRHLFELLEPELTRNVSIGAVELIQIYFHAVILGRAKRQIDEHKLRLPELTVLLELDPSTKMWFRVLDMVGGFHFWFESKTDGLTLISESWCRVVGGSGERHEITTNGLQLVDRGFV